jgi:hypothetical protein
MIDAAIFVLHVAACVYAFLRYKKEGISEGVLAVAFVVVIFSVGWTITTMLAKIVYPYQLVQEWVRNLQGTVLSRRLARELSMDTFSLIVLTVGEVFFYYFYLRSGGKKEETKTGN